MARALVIGGTGGLGSSVVRRMVSAGDDVTFTYLKAEQSAHRLCEALADEPGSVRGRQLDVRSPEAIAKVVAEAGADGLDAIVFSAATTVPRPIKAAKLKHWDFAFQANARAFGLLYQTGLDPLAARKGALLTVSSVGSRMALPDYGLMGAMKAAIEALVIHGAVEAAPLGVRVNSVCPGVVKTKSLDVFETGNGLLDEAVRSVPMGRLVSPPEVAALVCWLAGPDAQMITGQNIVIDGGWELAGLLPRQAAR